MNIRTKRVYEKPAEEDGYRLLVDRLWPRGIKKSEARITEWMKELAPSSELRTWFGHDPGKWRAFKDRYLRELVANSDAAGGLDHVFRYVNNGTLTLLYGAKDETRNNAVALKEFIDKKLLS